MSRRLRCRRVGVGRDRNVIVEELMLPDGRSLSYVSSGPPDGPVVVVHDGYGSRLVAQLLTDLADDEGVRVIAPDRPGFWGSTPHSGAPLATWPGDLGDVLDTLGVEACAVLGVSAGCPFAFAAAVGLGARVQRVAIAGPMAPLGDVDDLQDMQAGQRRSLGLARAAPRLGAAPMRLASSLARRWPERVTDALIRQRPEVDASRMREPAF